MNLPKKPADYLTPERLAEDARIREEIKAELPELREHARVLHDNAMRNGTAPRKAISILRSERNRQGLTDNEMMARSGLDLHSLASMAGRDAKPSIETMEAYAKALGKKLLIVLADDGDSGEDD